jgi:hypothetical protein
MGRTLGRPGRCDPSRRDAKAVRLPGATRGTAMSIEPLLDLGSLELRNPLLVGAFLGWADASVGASGAVRFLIDSLNAERLATWDGEDYYDFVELRPVSRTVDGNDRALDWPHGEFWFVRDVPTSMMGLALSLGLDDEDTLGARTGRSLVLFVAPEPRMRWRSHSREMAAFLRQIGVQHAAFMGSAFADVPHTRPPLVTGWATDASVRVRLESLGVPFSPYQGPSSMQSATIEGLRHEGIACVSLFGNGPHYLPVPNANVSHALLRRLCATFDLAVDLSALRETGQQLVAQANNAVQERAELREHVERLEVQYDAQGMPFAPGESLRRDTDGPSSEENRGLEVDPKDLVRDLEAFLRRRQQDGSTDSPQGDESP